MTTEGTGDALSTRDLRRLVPDGLPASWLALAIVTFPVGRRPAEILFVGSVIAAALVSWPREDRERMTRLGKHAAVLLVATVWLLVRVAPPWGGGIHTFNRPGLYPVTLLDYLPFLWGFFVLSWHRFEVREVRLVLGALAATGPIYAVLVLGQVQFGWHGSWSLLGPETFRLIELDLGPTRSGRATGGYLNGNALAVSAIYGLTAAVALLRVVQIRRHRFHTGRPSGLAALLVGALTASTWVLLRSGSRVAWFVAAVLLFGAALRLAPRLRRVALTTAAVVGVLLLLSTNDVGRPTSLARSLVPDIVWGRVSGAEEFRAGDLTWRRGVWDCGFDLIRERPVAGWGLGSFGPECEQRRRLAQPRREIRVGSINHAHNLFVQMAAELGVPFTVLLCLWLLWILWGAVRGLLRAPPGEERRLRTSLLLIVASVLVVSQINLAVAHDTRLEIVFWVSLAMAVSPLGQPPPPRLSRSSRSRKGANGRRGRRHSPSPLRGSI